MLQTQDITYYQGKFSSNQHTNSKGVELIAGCAIDYKKWWCNPQNFLKYFIEDVSIIKSDNGSVMQTT